MSEGQRREGTAHDHTRWSNDTAADPLEQLAAELRARWRKGERIPIERLGGLYPRIAADVERLLDLIYHEILVREEFGERVEADGFVERFPHLADRIERLFEIHRMMEDAEGSSESAAEQLRGTDATDSAGGTSSPHTSRPLASHTSDESTATPDSVPRDAVPPDYELLRELGRGGMAVVYQARQISLNRIVALKMIATPRRASSDELARFRQEAHAAAQLHHPHVVQIFDVGLYGGRPYLVLEYVAGGSLQHSLDGRPMNPHEAARLLETLGRAAHHAHRRGIVHRDLKPSNILLAPADDGSPYCPKISDFGLAKAAESDHQLTLTGQVIGTPSYMSPEQAAGKGDQVTLRSDIYSLGAILYQLLTGHAPFVGPSLLDVLDLVKNHEPVPPRRLQPAIPRDLETICLHCLAKSPERRYASAEALADDLQRFLEHRPIQARPASPFERMLKWTQRRPLVASLTVACLLSVVGGMLGIGWQTLRMREYAERAVEERDHAHRLHREAVSQMRQAEQARAESLRHADEAARFEQEAHRNFQRAFLAVDQVRRRGAEYFQQADRASVGRELLDFTLEYYDGFLAEEVANPVVRAAAVQAFMNAGDIANSLGDRTRGAAAYQRAIELSEQLVKQSPQSWDAWQSAGDAARKLGHVHRRMYRRDEAQAAYQSAIKHYSEAIRLAPAADSVRARIANTRLNMALTFRARGHYREAGDHYADAEQLLRQITSESAGREHLGELATCLDDAGRLARQRGRMEEAASKIREAHALRARLHQQQPEDARVQQLLARSHVSLALLDQDQQQWPEAIAHVVQAVELLTALADARPQRLDMQQELPATLMVHARLLGLAERIDEAILACERAQTVVDRMTERFPDDVATAVAQAHQTYVGGEILWEAGRNEEATTSWRLALERYVAIRKRWPENKAVANSLAWLIATCPAEDVRKMDEALRLAVEATEADQADANYQNTLGVVRYHAQAYDAAIEALEKSVDLNQSENQIDLLFLALAHQSRNHPDVAAEWLQRYDNSPAKVTAADSFATRRFHAEAVRLREQLERRK